MICNDCNKEIDDNASFCKYCGSSVIGSSSPLNTSTQAGFSSDISKEPVQPEQFEDTTAFNDSTFDNSSDGYQNGHTDYNQNSYQGSSYNQGGNQSNSSQGQGGYNYGANGYNSNQYAGSDNQKESAVGEGFAIASLVIGIGQMLCFCIPYLNLIPAIIGLVLGVLGLKSNKRGLAIAGVVLCCVFLLLSLVYTIWFTYDTFY